MNAGQVRPRFEPTINWGHVLILCGFVATSFFYVGDIRETLTKHDQRLLQLERQAEDGALINRRVLEMLSEIKADIAVLKDQRLREERP